MDDNLVEEDAPPTENTPSKDDGLVEVGAPLTEDASSKDEYFIEEDSPPIEGAPSKGKMMVEDPRSFGFPLNHKISLLRRDELFGIVIR